MLEITPLSYINDSISVKDSSGASHSLNNKLVSKVELGTTKDTFRFNVDTLSLYRAYIDDTLWVADSTLKKRFSLHLEMSGNKTISKFKDKEVIKNILNESILIRGKNDKIGLFIPSETQVHLQKNGNWLK